ncbi:MAG: hypothetical protein KAU14_01415, partial [Thermoplasmata archaeon]|nr:hypothetical protein [Thermoplasmata archaeon]
LTVRVREENGDGENDYLFILLVGAFSVVGVLIAAFGVMLHRRHRMMMKISNETPPEEGADLGEMGKKNERDGIEYP